MPWKIRELAAELTRNGFVRVRGRGKGFHRVYGDPMVGVVSTIAGRDGDDAKAYREKHVRVMVASAKRSEEFSDMKGEKFTKREIKEVAARYPRFIRWSDEDGCYVGSLPDLNGECAHGDSREQVVANLVECAELYVELMNAVGFPLPEPARSGRANGGQEEK